MQIWRDSLASPGLHEKDDSLLFSHHLVQGPAPTKVFLTMELTSSALKL